MQGVLEYRSPQWQLQFVGAFQIAELPRYSRKCKDRVEMILVTASPIPKLRTNPEINNGKESLRCGVSNVEISFPVQFHTSYHTVKS
ncbi:MAG: hypothetical protein CL912_18430 [Deltaproteobacteria bacterium]|nr:hypothetical protein [Deltaproteobacteria bacterium]